MKISDWIRTAATNPMKRQPILNVIGNNGLFREYLKAYLAPFNWLNVDYLSETLPGEDRFGKWNGELEGVVLGICGYSSIIGVVPYLDCEMFIVRRCTDEDKTVVNYLQFLCESHEPIFYANSLPLDLRGCSCGLNRLEIREIALRDRRSGREINESYIITQLLKD